MHRYIDDHIGCRHARPLLPTASEFKVEVESAACVHRPMGIDPTFICARAAPKLTGDLDRVDAGLLPPCSLVARAMNRAVMDSAHRHREFIAGLAAERPWLQVSKMMRV